MRDWLKNLLSASGEVQTKKVAYLVVVFSSVVWLSISLPVTTEWNVAFGLLLTTVSSGYLGGKAIEK